MNDSSKLLREKSFAFALRIVKLVHVLEKESRDWALFNQLLKSGTSIGANITESQNAQSDADFLSKMSIAYKEADETDFWINLLHDNGYLDDKQFDSLKHDMDRILKILTSIVKTLNEKVKKK